MKGKLFVLVGESASGKSTLESTIVKSELCYGYISSTTRMRRSYEIEGVHYYFMSEEMFQTYLMQDQFIEYSTYETAAGKARYALHRHDLKISEGNQVCVVNPNGLSTLEKTVGKENIVSIYIHREDKARIISSLNRDTKDFEYTLRETIRRYDADKEDFKNIRDKVDYIIENKNDTEYMVKEFIKIMEKEGCKDERINKNSKVVWC